MNTRGSTTPIALAGIVAVAMGTTASTLLVLYHTPNDSVPSRAGHSAGDHPQVPQAGERFPTTIHRPAVPPRVDLGIRNAHGEPVTASCSTCHANRAPNQQNRTSADLDEFHQGMTLAHGTLSCLSCHNPNDYDSLRLADGTAVSYSDVMTLCAQCHGPQTRDYLHGAHGGMSGYWDLTRGPRVRNNCVDCHDPHAPAFPAMRPTFKPIDRFLDPE